MITGIVDLGSNTVRLSIYECQDSIYRQLLSKKVMAGLNSYIEKGKMSDAGIEKAIMILEDFKDIAKSFQIDDLHVFATAPLRNICNTDEVINLIGKRCGLSVDAISGKEEAILDFEGSRNKFDLENGILVDIGGGSTELVQFENREIVQAISLPEGSLSLYNKFCEDLFPTKQERKKMKQYIHQCIKNCDFKPSGKKNQVIGVGGTIRASYRFYQDIINPNSQDRRMEVNSIKKILNELKKPEKETYRKIIKTAPERIHTLLPGLIIFNAVLEEFNGNEIYVSEVGVREGYLTMKVMGQIYE